MGYVKDSMDAVRRVLAAQPNGRVPLVAFFDGNDGDPSVDSDIVIRSRVDGRQHVVSVQVGDKSVGPSTSTYETTRMGEFEFSRFRSYRRGATFGHPRAEFEAELHRALDAAADAFRPVPGPNHGTHPHAMLAVEESLKAAAAYNARLDADEHVNVSLNAEGGEGDDDVVGFVRADGTVLPVQVRTMPGGVSVHNVETGDLLLERRAALAVPHLAELIETCLDEARNQAPTP